MKAQIMRRMSQPSGGAGAQTVTLDKYPYIQLIEWSRFTALVEDGDATLIEIGFRLAASEYILRSLKITNAGQSLTVIGPCCIPGEAQPFARFTGTAAGEVLAFYAYGCGDEHE